VDRIPILRMGDLLLVTIQVDIHDKLAMTLQDDLTSAIERATARRRADRHLGLEMVDSFIARAIGNLSAMAGILDATTVVVGCSRRSRSRSSSSACRWKA
jgi:rsbT antagonist protein RsbS